MNEYKIGDQLAFRMDGLDDRPLSPSNLTEVFESLYCSKIAFIFTESRHQMQRQLSMDLQRLNLSCGVSALTRLVHFGQLISPEGDFAKDGTQEYDSLVLANGKGSTTLIVEDFHFFDRMHTPVLEQMLNGLDHFRYIVLVPTWPNFERSAEVKDFIGKNRIPSFVLEKGD